MTRPHNISGLLSVALALAFGWSGVSADVHPDEMVKASIVRLADTADRYNSGGEGRARILDEDIRLFLAEYTDIHTAARLILAGEWKTATPDQRGRFVEAYNNHVARLLVEFVPTILFDTFEIQPIEGGIEDPPLMSHATFVTSEDRTIHFTLVVHQREGRWRIFDVVAEGISYVKLYRGQFQREIADQGLEAAIARFEQKSMLGSALSQQK